MVCDILEVPKYTRIKTERKQNLKEEMKKALYSIYQWLHNSGRVDRNMTSNFVAAFSDSESEVSIRVFQKEDKMEVRISNFTLTVQRFNEQMVAIGAFSGRSIGDPDWHGYAEVILRDPVEINQFYHQLRHLFVLGRHPDFSGTMRIYESGFDQEKEEAAAKLAAK